jgi:hypothetical protein
MEKRKRKSTFVRLHLAKVVPPMPLRVLDLTRLSLWLMPLFTLSRVNESRRKEVRFVVERAGVGDGERRVVYGAEGTPDVDELGCVR